MKKKKSLVIFSPWSGDRGDMRKLRHYNFIKALEEQYGVRTKLIVENNSFSFKSKQLEGLTSEIFYVPAFDATKGSKKKVKRIASMLLYPLFSIFLYLSNSGIRKAGKYWVSSPHPGATIVGLFINIFKNKLLYEVRDPWPELPIKTGLIKERSLLAKAFKKIDIAAQNKSLKILLTSNSFKRYLENKNHKKTIVLGNGISTNLNSRPKHQFLKDNTLKLIFAGGCARAFRMDIVFKALEHSLQINKNLNVKFDLYIDEIEQKRFKRLIDDLGIYESVTFYNKVTYSEMLNKINQADFYILHITNDELFEEDINSNKLLDAFTCSKPVIFAAETQLNHIMKSNGGICSKPDSVEELSTAILKAASLSCEEYELQSKSMQIYSKDHLSIESRAQIIHDVFYL